MSITLNVDVANDNNIVAESYEWIGNQGDKALYHGPGHTLETRDTFELYRSLPKPNGNFKGVSKPAAKATKEITVTGADGSTTLTVPEIGNVSFSHPVGSTVPSRKAVRQRLIACLDDDSLWESLYIGKIQL